MRGKPSPEPTSFWPGGSAQTLPHPPGRGLGLGTVPEASGTHAPGLCPGLCSEPCDLGSACFFPVPNATLRGPVPHLYNQGQGLSWPAPPPPLHCETWHGSGLCSSSGFFFYFYLCISGPGVPGLQLIFITLVCGRC